MTPLLRARAIGLHRLGLGAGDIAWALGLPKATVIVFLLREV
jgi:hypothetical protein